MPDYESRDNSVRKAQSLPGKFGRMQEDILLQIFMILSGDIDPYCIEATDELWDWVRVTEVCSYWRAVATGAPKLWSFLHHPRTLRNTTQVKRFLLLSKDLDLTVNYDGRGKPLSSLIMVLGELRRIRHLRVVLPPKHVRSADEWTELTKLFDQHAPRAESIALSLAEPVLLFPITSPGVLQSVELSGIDFNLSSDVTCLSGITSLCLVHCKNLSNYGLFMFLKTSTRLSSLTISYCDIHHFSNSKCVQLPYLDYICLNFKHYLEIYYIILRLEAPKLSRWSIDCDEQVFGSEVAMLNVFSKLMEGKNDYYQSSILFSSHNGGFELKIEEGSQETALHFSFYRDSPDVVLAFRCLTEMLSNRLARVKHLNVQDIDYDIITVEDWRTVFFASGGVQSVHARMNLKMFSSEGLNCLKALGLRLPVSPGKEPEVPCPALRRVDINYDGPDWGLREFLPVLEEVLSARSTCGSAVRELSITICLRSRNFANYNIDIDETSKVLSQWVQELDWKFTGYEDGGRPML